MFGPCIDSLIVGIQSNSLSNRMANPKSENPLSQTHFASGSFVATKEQLALSPTDIPHFATVADETLILSI